ncbi:MAG: hypothetical protein HOV81_04430 [Kofleriaceae bacterium]|nr:hypothetical protein [Kofleriaceae bacterium]
MRLAALALLPLAACADPVVEMNIVLPKNADTFNTSCVTAVEIRTMGASYSTDHNDWQRSCVEVSSPASFATLRDAIRGKFDILIPDSGLSGLSLFGWSGPTPCKLSDDDPYYTPDVVAFGRADYIGQDVIDLPLTPNLDCGSRQSMTVRIVDMFTMLSGTAPSSASCTNAMAFPDMMGGVWTGTIMPKLFGKGAIYYGGVNGANGVGNAASFSGLTGNGSKSCLALDGGTVTAGSTSCIVPGNLCAAAGEYELVAVPNAVIEATPTLNPTLQAKFPGIIYGSVWTSGATRTPIAGATVEVDSKHGKVVYLDPPANIADNVHVRSDQSGTGPSGLFMLYTDTLVSVKVNGGGKTRTVTLGATDDSAAGAFIVMN